VIDRLPSRAETEGVRLWLLIIDVVGGAGVLGSYAWGIAAHDQPGRALWGGVPLFLRPLYQLSMLTATAGYFAFTWFLLWKLPESARIGRFGYGVLLPIHLLFLLPSALWMPLTFRYLDGHASWWAVRGVLLAVGVGALALIAALIAVEPRSRLAIAGACAFAFQTAVLDALVWPAFFRT
jgi:hypothetical protein